MKMIWLCLSAALLVSLVDSTPELRNNIQDQGQEKTSERHLKEHIVQEFPTQILKEEDKEASKPAFCMEPQSKGDCKAMIMRYFHNAETGLCEQFSYGGCGGNRNNFLTKEECVKTCSPGPGSLW
nr:pancreatic trypsin inhibitor-like [Odocoileus virginianus texanus]